MKVSAQNSSERQGRRFADILRRSFLMRCCEAAGSFLIPDSFRKAAFARSSSPSPEFHLHPQYREKTALDGALLQIKPGLDGFITERYHDSIAAILNAWGASLLEFPQSTRVLEDALGGIFVGTAWQPVESRLLRLISNGLDVRRLSFAQQASLARDAFLSSLRSSMGNFSKILTSEFQITGIESRAGGLTTRVRYELIGTGQGFFREGRIGDWSLDWEIVSQGSYRVVRWQAHDEVRSRSEQPFFADLAGSAFGGNSSYVSQMSHGADYWRTVLDGACGIDIYGHNGVSVGDIDGDGYDDVYVCQPAGLPNRLYRNRGYGTFEDVTESSGLGLLDNTACALFADFNNDGRQDLVVVRANGPLLFLNEGEGKFRLKPDAFQFASPPQGTFAGAAAADYDRDGRLDIYFCLYVYYQGTDQYRYPSPYFAAENGPPNFLMHNNGDGTFRDLTRECGLDKNNTRYSFCCGWGDYNGDGWPDLYVVNDFGRKNLYRNNGDRTFSDVTHEAGVEDLGAGMSVCWLDYNNDGAEDLYVANMWTAAGERITAENAFQQDASKQVQAMYRKHAMGNSLFRSGAGSAFRDVTEESQTGIGRWSWSSDAWDFDHDGFSDIYIANGMISGTVREDLNSFFWRQVVAKSPNGAKPAADYEQGWSAINEMIRSGYSWSGFERNVLYANNRDGTFCEVSGALGLDFLEDSRSFALADFDGDGRQELLLKNRNAPQLRLLKSTVPELPPAIAFRLRGTKSNWDAIGAAVTVRTPARNQRRLLQAGSGFLSQHSKQLFFGLGEAKGSVSATIRWPSGLEQELKDLPPNHRVSVTEGSEQFHLEPFKAHSSPSGLSVPQLGEMLPHAAETWLLVPVSAPNFSLVDAEGKSWTLSTLSGKPVLLAFAGPAERLEVFERHHEEWGRGGLRVVVLRVGEQAQPGLRYAFPVLRASDDVAATYNLLFQYLFDQHRNLDLPTSFLIDEHGHVVKIYQGSINPKRVLEDSRNIPRGDSERLAKALPFPGISSTFAFGRNYLSLGSIFFQRGYMESAREFFESALKDDPSSAEALYGIGSVYLKQEKNAAARDCFGRAVKSKASYGETTPNAWNNLGILAMREGDSRKAIDCFGEALKVDADDFVALENLGNAYRQQRRWEEAREVLERALAMKPMDAEANYSLGMVFAQLDQSSRAYEYLHKALEVRPAYPEALNNLGVLYLRTHRRDEAVANFEEAIRVAPAFDQSYLNLARVYAIEGDAKKARTVLLALLTQHPNHKAAQQALAQLDRQ